MQTCSQCNGPVASLGEKLALPTVELQEKHNIRGIVAVEDTSQLIFSAPIDELIIESES